METRKLQEKVVANIKRWQKVENEFFATVGQIMKKTDDGDVRQFMEIIRRDLAKYHRMQEFIAHCLEAGTVPLTKESLAKIWGMIEEHIHFLGEMIDLTEGLLSLEEGYYSWSEGLPS